MTDTNAARDEVPATTTDGPEWVPAHEAAELAGISSRDKIKMLALAGKIRHRNFGDHIWYAAEDARAMRAELRREKVARERKLAERRARVRPRRGGKP